MLRKTILLTLFVLSIFGTPATLSAEPQIAPAEITTIEITGSVVAVPEPASSYSTPVSGLRFEPFVDLQSRNTAEAQGDISIRGGIFENSGFAIGAANIFDPQTGHYAGELPVAATFLSAPRILTGTQNALKGFNTNAGIIRYGFASLNEGAELRIAAGDNDLNLQEGTITTPSLLNNDSLNLGINLARSESAGSVKFGDNSFERVAANLQLKRSESETNFILGYQDKYFSWPNLYAPGELHTLVGSSGIESESLQTTLLLLNHIESYNENNRIELSSYFRRHKDDYEFDIFNPGLFNDFKHRSEVFGFSADGLHNFSSIALNYRAELIFDDLKSTSLTAGPYTSRSYFKTSIAPEFELSSSENSRTILLVGSSFDDTDRTSSSAAGIARLEYRKFSEVDWRYFLEYSGSSQLPGYTATGSSSTSGLFRGNQSLSRERSHNYQAGFDATAENWRASLAVFYREDRDLVDWTYDSSITPFAARAANNVDIDTSGLEALFEYEIDPTSRVATSYTFLSKDEDYGDTTVDASFYALNFARHRATLSFVYAPVDQLELRMDNEFRVQRDNPLRSAENKPVLSSLALSFSPESLKDTALTFSVDNLWNQNFEEVPGVPGRRRQMMISGKVIW